MIKSTLGALTIMVTYLLPLKLTTLRQDRNTSHVYYRHYQTILPACRAQMWPTVIDFAQIHLCLCDWPSLGCRLMCVQGIMYQTRSPTERGISRLGLCRLVVTILRMTTACICPPRVLHVVYPTGTHGRLVHVVVEECSFIVRSIFDSLQAQFVCSLMSFVANFFVVNLMIAVCIANCLF